MNLDKFLLLAIFFGCCASKFSIQKQIPTYRSYLLDNPDDENSLNHQQDLMEISLSNDPSITSIDEQIISQLDAQSISDNNRSFNTDKQITFSCSVDIILQDIFIEDSMQLLPVTITTTKSITIKNITIANPDKAVYMTLMTQIIWREYWMKLISPVITIQDIYFNTPLNNNSISPVGLFHLYNFSMGTINNFQVLGYSATLLNIEKGDTLEIQNLVCQQLYLINQLVAISQLNKLNIKDASFTKIIVVSTSMILLKTLETALFDNVVIKYNKLEAQQNESSSLIKADSVNNIRFHELFASFNNAMLGFLIIQANNISYFLIHSSNLVNNIYPENQKGGLIYLFRSESNSKFEIQLTNFEKNGASSDKTNYTNGPNIISYFKAIQIDMQTIFIGESQFINNLGGVFDLKNIQRIYIINCKFFLNQGYSAPTLTIDANIESVLVLEYANFIQNSVITNQEGTGGIIFINYIKEYQILRSNFLNNTVGPNMNGGVICFEEIFNATFENCVFQQNSASNGGAIYGRAINKQIRLVNSNFIQNSAVINGGAFFILQLYHLIIADCFISQNTAGKNGGFLQAKTILYQLLLTTSQFFENSASNSGGVFLIQSSQFNLIIDHSQIHSNSAKTGGFLAFNALTSLSLYGLNHNINQTVIFGNTALLGGALFLYSIEILKIDQYYVGADNILSTLSNLFSQNIGIQQGNTFFSSPTIVELVGAQEYQDNLGDQCELPLKVTQGNELDLGIPSYIIHSVNSNSIVRLQFKLQSSFKEFTTQRRLNNQVEAPSDYFAQMTIDGELKLFEAIQEATPQCDEGDKSIFDISYKLNFMPSSGVSTTITFFSQIDESRTIKIKWNFRSCETGEIFTQQGGIPLCFPCPYHTYSFRDPYQGVSCIPIPIVGVQECYKNVMNLQPGYWRQSLNSSEIIECSNNYQSCIGGTDVGYQLCSVGHIGPLCEQCDLQGIYWGESYSQGQGYHCQKCSDIKNNIAWIIIALVFIIIFCVIVCKSSFQSTANSIFGQYLRKMDMCRLGNCIVKQNLFSSYIKILFSYLQLQWVLQTLSVRPLGIFSAISNSITQPVTITFLSLDCFLQDLSPNSVLYFKMIFVAILPVGVILLILLLIFTLFSLKLISLQQRKHYLFSSILYCIVSLIQFNVVHFLLQSSICREIGSNSYAFLDLTLSCNDSNLVKYKIFLIFPLLFIWTIALPLGLFYFLLSRKDKLEKSALLQVQFRFLYGEYKQSFFYWELIRLYLRMIVAYIFTQFYSWASISGLIILFILIVYETGIIYFSPFQSRDLNYLEGESIFIAMLNIFLAMIYYNLIQNQANPQEFMDYEYTNFWEQPSFITGFVIAIIQFLNFYFIIKYIFLSFYTLLEHHPVVRNIEMRINRYFPRVAQLICKKRTNGIQVSMRWNKVKQLIKSRRVFSFITPFQNTIQILNQQSELSSLFDQQSERASLIQQGEEEQMITLIPVYNQNESESN